MRASREGAVDGVESMVSSIVASSATLSPNATRDYFVNTTRVSSLSL
jgi:hypothetical protein